MKKAAAVFAGYWAVFLFLFRDAAFGPTAFIGADIYPFYYPVWSTVTEMLRSGVLPLWNPYMGFGAPLLASPQACVFYPLTFFFFAPDFLLGLNHYLLFHLAMASFFTYLFVRDSEVSEGGALVAGLAFGLSGYMLGSLRMSISLCSAAYFPLALFFLRRSFRDGRFQWKAAAAAALLLQYLAGDPMISFVTVLVCALAALVRRKFVPFLIVAACFAGLSAFQSLLFLEFLSQSTRSLQDAAAATKWSVAPAQLWDVLFPSVAPARHWLSHIYLGLFVFFLAVFGAARGGKMPKKLLGLALFGLALSLGSHSFVYEALVKFVWPFGIIRFPGRFFFLVLFALACLAGFGFDRLGWRSGRRTFWKTAFALLWIFLDLGSVNAVEPRIPRAAASAVPANVEEVLKDPGLFRVMTSPETVAEYEKRSYRSVADEVREYGEVFFPNMPMRDGVHFFWAYDSLLLSGPDSVHARIQSEGLEKAKPRLDLMNVKYVAHLQESAAGFELVRREPAGNLFRNPDAAPRAFLAPEAFVERIGKEPVDVRSLVRPGEAEILDYSPNRVRMRAEAREACWLFFSDSWYPGWKARIDGRLTAIRKVGGVFRAVPLEAGSHEVVWTYDPPLFKWGMALSLLTLAVMAWYTIPLWHSKKSTNGTRIFSLKS